MSRTATVLVVLLVVAPMAGTTVAGADQVTMTITVTDQSGNAVSGADLTVTWDGGSATEQTRANGKALVDVPENADVEIDVEHPDYVRNRPYEVENASGQEVTVEMYQRGTATISVTDNGDSLADARVILRKQGRVIEDDRTASDGTYNSDVIEQGEYKVTVVKRGYYQERFDLTVDGDVEQDVRLDRGTVTLRVRVNDSHFDPPRTLEGATISIESIGEFVTQPEGTASVGVPVNSRLEVTVTADEYEQVTRTVSVDESDVSLNVSIARTPQLTLEAANERVIAGERTVVTVRNEYDEPVEGATVLLDDEPVGETDANGQHAVQIPEAGDYTLVAEREDVRSDTVSVTGVTVDGETPTETEDSDASGPGFTIVIALLALLVAGMLAARR